MRLQIFLITLIILAIIPPTSAQEAITDFNQYSYVTMNFNIKGGFNIHPTGTKNQILEIITNVSFIPIAVHNQKILEIKTNSEPKAATTTADILTYTWQNTEAQDYTFNFDSKVKVINSIVTVEEKIIFPISRVNEEYIKPAGYIDITPEIRSKALEIAEGEDDLYVVTFKMGEWVRNNIKYDLSTLTADVVQKSSWVLENKEGVCDELTNLFISMLRSVGIPARFVSGMAYTNIGNTWGPHAWAEVYFPDKGWVPFDVTYGQFGWIDPSHIKVSTSKDAGQTSVSYSWKAYQADFNAKKINITTNLAETGLEVTSPVDITITPLANDVGPGSQVPFAVEVKNKRNHYMPIVLAITKAPGLTETNFRPVLLKPRETKRFYWTAKIDTNIQSGYVYKTQLEVEDQFHKTATSEINYAQGKKVIKSFEAKKIIEELEVKEQKVYSPNIKLECTTANSIFVYEQLSVNCTVTNIGNTGLTSIDVCMEKICNRLTSLTISEQKQLNFRARNLIPGLQSITLTAKTGNIQGTESVVFEVLNSPDLNIAVIEYPHTLKYKDEFQIEMTMVVKAPVKDVKIKIKGQDVVKTDNIKNSNKILIKTKAQDYWEEQTIPITITFKDKNDREYSVDKEYEIKIEEIPLYAKLFSWLKVK